MHRIHAPVKSLDIKSYDGTSLRVYTCGTGKHRWLLPPGLGTPLVCWKYIFEYFQDRMSIVTWDPRGCYDSKAPADLSHLTVDDHVRDAEAVLDAVGWKKSRFVTGGWSMGVEIGLEIYRKMPERIAGLTLINGTFEHVLSTAFNLPKADEIFGGILRAATKISSVFSPLSAYLLSQSWTVPFLKSLRLVTNNEDFFIEALKEFRRLDFGVYFPMMLALSEHSADDVLTSVNIPTLITVGTADKMTPVSVGEYMHERIAGSELFVIPNGTHYTTMEYPEIVNLKLEQFFRRRVFGDAFDRIGK